MVLSKMNSIKKESGFTIVELLIVIVVIGILAAITIVAYSGITARANTTKAAANAQSVQKVAEAYNADLGYYPQTITHFTTGSLSTKLPTGVTVQAAAPTTGQTTQMQYHYCGATVTPAASATLGGKITYFDTAANAVAIVYVGTGASGLGVGAGTVCHTWQPTS